MQIMLGQGVVGGLWQLTEKLHVGGSYVKESYNKTRPVHFGESVVLFIQPHLMTIPDNVR